MAAAPYGDTRDHGTGDGEHDQAPHDRFEDRRLHPRQKTAPIARGEAGFNPEPQQADAGERGEERPGVDAAGAARQDEGGERKRRRDDAERGHADGGAVAYALLHAPQARRLDQPRQTVLSHLVPDPERHGGAGHGADGGQQRVEPEAARLARGEGGDRKSDPEREGKKEGKDEGRPRP